MTTDPIDHAYLAGLLDGEGSISCSDTVQGSYLFVVVGMNCRDPLDWLVEKYGGKVYVLQDGYTFQWCAPAGRRQDILAAALPYLKVKKRQAELGIAFCGTVRVRSDRSTLTEKELLVKKLIASELRELNRRGKILKVQ